MKKNRVVLLILLTALIISTKAIVHEFQENTKILAVPTNNICDQKYFRNIIRTSLCNSTNRSVPI